MRFINNRKVIDNIGWLIFDKVFTLLIALFVIVKIANYYGPTEYGLYQYALSITVLLGIIVVFIDGRVIKKRYQEFSDGSIIYNVIITKIFLSLVVLIIGIGLLIVLNKESKFNIIFMLLLINNVIINLRFGMENYFEYKLKSKKVVIVGNITSIISSILQLLAISLGFSIIAIVVIVLFSSLIRLFLIVIQFRNNFNIKIEHKFNHILVFSMIRESVPLAIAAAAATIYSRVDQVMIGSMLNVTEVGIYSISFKMVGVVAIVLSPIQISIFPKMIDWYNNNRELYYKRYQSITSMTTWLYIIIIGITFITLPFLFNIFFSDVYIKSLDIFKIQVIGTLFMYNAALRSSHFTLTKNTKVMMISQIIAVFINIGLNFLMIPRIGLYGAALSTAITQFISLFVFNLFFKNGKDVFLIQLKGFNPKYIFKKY